MNTIEERLIQAIAEVIEDHVYHERYSADEKCDCCHQYVTHHRHEDSCAIPLLQNLRHKLMEGLHETEDVVE